MKQRWWYRYFLWYLLKCSWLNRLLENRRALYWLETKQRVVTFILNGGLLFLAGWVIMFIFVEWVRLDKNLAFPIQLILIVQASFFVHYHSTWEDRKEKPSKKQRGKGWGLSSTMLRQWALFNAVKLVMVAVSQVIFVGLTLFFHYLVVTAICEALFAVFGYLTNDWIIFRPNPLSESQTRINRLLKPKNGRLS